MFGIFEVFVLIKNLYQVIFNKLDNIVFNVNGVNASYLELLLAIIFMGMIISIFWKGAKG